MEATVTVRAHTFSIFFTARAHELFRKCPSPLFCFRHSVNMEKHPVQVEELTMTRSIKNTPAFPPLVYEMVSTPTSNLNRRIRSYKL